MRVEVCAARSTEATRIAVDLDDGATVGDAVAASGIVALLGLDATALSFAVFGRRARADRPLAEGDRIDLVRPLEVEPNAARLARAAARRSCGR